MSATDPLRSPRVRHFASLLARLQHRALAAEEMAHAAVGLVARVMGTDVASMYAHDRGAGELVLAATHGLPRSAVGHVTLPVGEGISGRAARHRTPVGAADVRAHPHFRLITAFDQSDYRSLLAVPMMIRDDVVGTVNVQTAAVHDYDQREIDDLVGIAQVLAPSVAWLWRGDLPARLRGPSAAARLDAGMTASATDADIVELFGRELRRLFPLHAVRLSLRASDGTAGSADGSDGSAGDAVIALHGAGGQRRTVVLTPLEPDVAPLSDAAVRMIETLGAQVTSALDARLPAAALDAGRVAEADTALETLVRLVLDDVGLDAVVTAAEELCGHPLALTDVGGSLIAGTLVTPVVANLALRTSGALVGRLLAPASPDAVPAIGAAANAMALELSKWQVSFEAERRLRSEGLDLLLAARGDERELATRSQRLGIDLSRPYLPVVYAFDSADLSAMRGPLALPALERTLLRALGDTAACFVHPEGLLVLVAGDDPEVARRCAAAALVQARRSVPNLLVAAGTADPALDVADYGPAVQRAVLAATIALRRGRQEPLDAGDLGVDQLFVAIADDHLLNDFVERQIGVLLHQDRTQGTEWVRTLEAYHASGERAGAAARELFIHVSTLRYRLDRIATLTGRDLRSPPDRFGLYVAVHAHRFVHPSRSSLLAERPDP